jgi:hypothetical protein
MLSNVELNRPQRMTTAIGDWISLPGSPLASARGTSANAVASAARDQPFFRRSLGAMLVDQALPYEDHAVAGRDEYGDEANDRGDGDEP